jgi:hypothetical protein
MSLLKIMSIAAVTATLISFAAPAEAASSPQYLLGSATTPPQDHRLPPDMWKAPWVASVSVPEPGAWALMFLGMAGVGGAARYARRRTAAALA